MATGLSPHEHSGGEGVVGQAGFLGALLLLEQDPKG